MIIMSVSMESYDKGLLENRRLKIHLKIPIEKFLSKIGKIGEFRISSWGVKIEIVEISFFQQFCIIMISTVSKFERKYI